MNLRRKSSRQEFAASLAKCRPEDFDGHTGFQQLTPEQRLEWLCQAAAFVYEFRGTTHPGAAGRPQDLADLENIQRWWKEQKHD